MPWAFIDDPRPEWTLIVPKIVAPIKGGNVISWNSDKIDKDELAFTSLCYCVVNGRYIVQGKVFSKSYYLFSCIDESCAFEAVAALREGTLLPSEAKLKYSKARKCKR